MNVVSIIVFVILALFVLWLLIDTIRYVIVKIKAKKNKNKNDVIDNETTSE